MLKRKHDKIINIMQLRFFCQVALRVASHARPMTYSARSQR